MITSTPDFHQNTDDVTCTTITDNLNPAPPPPYILITCHEHTNRNHSSPQGHQHFKNLSHPYPLSHSSTIQTNHSGIPQPQPDKPHHRFPSKEDITRCEQTRLYSIPSLQTPTMFSMSNLANHEFRFRKKTGPTEQAVAPSAPSPAMNTNSGFQLPSITHTKTRSFPFHQPVNHTIILQLHHQSSPSAPTSRHPTSSLHDETQAPLAPKPKTKPAKLFLVSARTLSSGSFAAPHESHPLITFSRPKRGAREGLM